MFLHVICRIVNDIHNFLNCIIFLLVFEFYYFIIINFF